LIAQFAAYVILGREDGESRFAAAQKRFSYDFDIAPVAKRQARDSQGKRHEGFFGFAE
jgi:hypothetical protein